LYVMETQFFGFLSTMRSSPRGARTCSPIPGTTHPKTQPTRIMPLTMNSFMANLLATASWTPHDAAYAWTDADTSSRRATGRHLLPLYYTALEATDLDQILTILRPILTGMVKIGPWVPHTIPRRCPGALAPCATTLPVGGVDRLRSLLCRGRGLHPRHPHGYSLVSFHATRDFASRRCVQSRGGIDGVLVGLLAATWPATLVLKQWV
jgi:hypothetical protein